MTMNHEALRSLIIAMSLSTAVGRTDSLAFASRTMTFWRLGRFSCHAGPTRPVANGRTNETDDRGGGHAQS